MPEYNLDALGWYQFERLCQSLLKAKNGLAVEAWGRSGDMGRDAYAEGPLRHPGTEENPGPFVFQVKFVSGANAAGAKSLERVETGVKAELARIGERAAAGLWERPRYYTLLTNAPLTGKGRREVKQLLTAGLPESEILIQDGADVDALLDDSPRVRLSFPQVLGLRDIFALLDERVHKDILTRSSLGLELAGELAASFVATDAYTKALNVLSSRNFVVLTGPPEMGKTSIAWMIALARLSGEWDAFECRAPEDMFKVLNPERPQVFVVDDAFGSTEYQPDRATLWGEELDKVIRALDYRHWLLLTSRPAPLKTALERLSPKGEASDFPDPQKVLVDASILSVQEKAQMLYRHAKAAVPDEEGRALIRDHAREIVDNEHFTPLRIHRFVTRQLEAILRAPAGEERDELMATAVASNLETPTREMTTSFGQLPADCKALLITMLDSTGVVIEMAELEVAFERHLGTAPERSAEATAALIDEHFVRVLNLVDPASGEADSYLEWVHPSVRDLVIDHLMGDAAARRAFLRTAGFDGIMLALSSEGGAMGERLFPLLVDAEDWRAVTERLAELPAVLGRDSAGRLAALLADTARLAGSEEAVEHAAELRELTRIGLEATREHWNGRGDALGNGELRNFYQASTGILPPVAGADLSSTWKARIELVEALIGSDIAPLVDAAEAWLNLALLLRRYEPRWLIGLSFPARQKALLEEILERIGGELDEMEGPAIVEEDDPEEYAEAPPDLDWLVTAENVIDAILHFEPELAERCEVLPAQLDERGYEWQEYGERHEAYANPEQDEDDDRYGRFGESGEVFDIGEFFADL